MIQDELRSSKMQPRYTGPFKVLRRNRGGAYELQCNDGSVYTRPPHRLKLIRQEPIPQGDTHHVVSSILKHSESSTGQNHYLVRWKDKSLSDSWVLEKDFDDLTPIRKYWQTNRTASNAPALHPAKKIKVNLRMPNPQ